ncbi:hypothetical protein E0H86_01135 [Acinetobacter sp. ANC 4635]|uniref:hypothetical protein n=1 Tax=Acinetobacter sp. ANC 4635 TaxID=2529846 RepID=UPI00103950EA|nr:hypothetical protein [Acinetobacter sp. ANC 4635]TCB33273.1 hypothetical protein E0H86_01135 [Acinetobacter sp. ANC 4635]
MKTLTATILGLNSEASQALKLDIETAIPHGFVIEWVTLLDKTVDVMFINHHFLDSKAIQNYLQQHPDVHYLYLEYNATLAGKILNNQLYYPFENSTDLSAWLRIKFVQIAPKVQHIPLNLSKYIEEMLVPRNSFLRLYQHEEDLAIIDTRTERIFLHPNLPIQQFFSPNVEQSYAKSSRVNAVQGYFKVADLKVWLWETLYPARHTFTVESIPLHNCYRLLQWPQFTTCSERKYLLKMAALFARGAEIEYVMRKANCSAQQVKEFIYLTQLLGMSEQIPNQETRFLVHNVEQESTSMGIFQGLFGKLRRKLGI